MATQPSHRPWPVLEQLWFMKQTWRNVLFLHWPLPETVVQQALPKPLRPFLDTFQGSAWVGIVAFEAINTRLAALPPVPGFSDFPELNVRTYLTINGKAGVYFFSLDTPQLAAVAGARLFYSLRYFPAQLVVRPVDNGYVVRSKRIMGGTGDLLAVYRPKGSDPFREAPKDERTRFLMERYCLYAVDPAERVRRAEIDHKPWLVREAEVEIRQNSMLESLKITTPNSDLIAHFSSEQTARIWLPKTVRLNQAVQGRYATTVH